MKRHELLFGIIKIPLDFIIIVGAFFIARQLRSGSDFVPGFLLPLQTISSHNMFIYGLIGGLIFLLTFTSHGLYSLSISNSKIKEGLDIIRYSFYSFIFFSVIVFLGRGILLPGEDIPRLVIIFTFFIATICIIFSRLILNKIQLTLLNYGYLSKNNLIIITNKDLAEISYILKDIKKARIYKIIGYINTRKIDLPGYHYLGGLKEISKILSHKLCDEILYIDSDFKKDALYKIWEVSRIYGVRYRYISNTFDVTKGNTELSLINEVPVIEIKNTPLDNWSRIGKRSADILISSAALIILSPLIAFFSLLIKWEDPSGPAIYKNRRVGQNGKIFNLYKLRYMRWKYCVKDSYGIDEGEDSALDYEKTLIAQKSSRNGPLYKIKNDPRRTKIGKFIEKYSLDEFPQFFNVFIGDMSLVGPRPHQPREVKDYDIHHNRLLTIKPGITGMAQVNGRESNDFDTEANLDIFYIENWSILLDLKIVFKTFYTVIKRK